MPCIFLLITLLVVESIHARERKCVIASPYHLYPDITFFFNHVKVYTCIIMGGMIWHSPATNYECSSGQLFVCTSNSDNAQWKSKEKAAALYSRQLQFGSLSAFPWHFTGKGHEGRELLTV